MLKILLIIQKQFFYDNIKLDHNFNAVYEELFDNGGVLQQKIEREFEYY